MKPFSQACENNRPPILEALRPRLAGARDVLEIGSGTGQHAVAFGAALAPLVWHTSDRAGNHPGIVAWLDESGLGNVRPPLDLDVDREDAWPARAFDAVFSANTAHIMSWPSVVNMLSGVGRLLPAGGRFFLYGPFARAGRHVSGSNARFDAMLRTRDPVMGVRDLDDLESAASAAGMRLEETLLLPANNHLLVWRRVDGPAAAV